MYIKEYYIIKNKITKKTNYNSSEESRLNNIPMCERNLENFINIYEKVGI